MDIIKTREQLNLLINGLIDGYIENEKSTGEFMTKRSKEIKDYTQNMESLINEIKQKDKTIGEKDDEIRNINKTKHEYELMINKLNEKIVELETEENQKNKHDMIKVQAKELDEKDRVIEQLQNKILKLKGDPKSSVEKQLNEYNDMIDDPEKEKPNEQSGKESGKQVEHESGEESGEEVEHESDQELTEGKIVVTDGACSGKGKSCAKAGIGVYFSDADKRNVSKRIPGKQTNNAAELSAILEVFNICEKELDNGDKLTIYSDSNISIGCNTHLPVNISTSTG